MEATSMSSNNSLKKLCEQYDQEMADIEVDLDIHDKVNKLMKENRVINQQQFSSMQKNTEQTEKELQLLDEKTNELVQSTNSQGEKIEELKRVQQQIMSGISDAQHCLIAAQNTTRDDLERLHSTEREAQKFLESNLVSSKFSGVASKLQNCQKTFSSKVQESIDHLASVKSIVDEADHLHNLEKVLGEIRMDAANLEGRIGEIDAQCLVYRNKIAKLSAEQEEEKQRRNAISEKYQQRKRRVADLTRNLSSRKNDKKLLSESMNSKEQELNKNEERFKKKNADSAAIQQEVDAIKDELAKLEDAMRFEREIHEQKVQEIKEGGEANLCATKSVLMGLCEKKNTKLIQIQQARDDLNKKSELEAHKKINEEMERNLEQLKQEKAQLQLEVDEKESRRNAQLSGMKAMKSAFQENKLEASKKREFLMGEVKRMNEQILGLKHKIQDFYLHFRHLYYINMNGKKYSFIESYHYITKKEERRLKTQRNAMNRQLKMVALSKGIGTLMRCAFEKDEKSRQDGAGATHGSPTKGSTDQGEIGQEPQRIEFDEIGRNEESVKDVKSERSGDEEIIVRETDPQKLLPKKSAENEKMNPTFVASEIKEPFPTAKRSGEREITQISSAEQEELEFLQPTTKYKASRYDLLNKNFSVSNTSPVASKSSKVGRQTRKKREQKKEQIAENDESSSSFYHDAVEDTQKKRGRQKGKKAGRGRGRGRGTRARNDNSKLRKNKDAYDLDSDFD
ncbi:unnamed protein product [Cercopithifilaria johnstoni]|uniref:Uncharacterized protein n=1 Tax=Cercopithifilaria johnstoni TaxID=2874296 RepID=A0A8J2Q7I1_9BILA|nr:unnamed protein product [Cercopithifilaria johnstoni]